MMSSFLYWPLVAIGFIIAVLVLGSIMCFAWVALVEIYTAYVRWRCRRDPVYFMKKVIGLEVTPYQAKIMAAPIEYLRQHTKRVA